MTDDAIYEQAVSRFHELLRRATESPLREPAAAVLATIDAAEQPAARVVLIRGADLRGFVFFTNDQSSKGRQLAANPKAALCVYWDSLREQVRIEGAVESVAANESDAYWQTRPRDSQIGAWASSQSEPLPDRATLEDRFTNFEKKFAGRDVPRPEHWRGYRLAPTRIEFWSGRDARLHERVEYRRVGPRWTVGLLYP